MAQPFTCTCATPSCRGTISGARDMPAAQLEGVWISTHIRELLQEQQQNGAPPPPSNFKKENGTLDGEGGRNGVTSRELSGEMGGDTNGA